MRSAKKVAMVHTYLVIKATLFVKEVEISLVSFRTEKVHVGDFKVAPNSVNGK
jgi:hypothetical protein